MRNVKEIYENFVTIDDAMKLSYEEVKENYKTYQNAMALGFFEAIGVTRNYVKAEGSKFIDDEGNEYLDFLGGVGVLNIGHNNKEVFESIDKVFGLPCTPQLQVPRIASAFAKNLAMTAPKGLSKVWFGTGGAEAVEGAMKCAKMATNRSRFVSTFNAFHGKTAGALSVTRQALAKNQGTLLPGVNFVPYGDTASLELALQDKNVAAFIAEPIQGEGGINVPPPGYFKAVRSLCDKYGTLFIADEVQTGVGRTGTLWAVEYEDVIPDILVFAKGVSGGLIPLAGYITKPEIWDAAFGSPETGMIHTNTYGNNTLACAVGLRTLQYVIENDLPRQSKEKGEYVLEKLKAIASKYPLLIKEVRGRGLFIGIEFKKQAELLKMAEGAVEIMAFTLCKKLFEIGKCFVAFTFSNPTTIRVEPPLNTTYEQLDTFINVFEKAIFAALKELGIKEEDVMKAERK